MAAPAPPTAALTAEASNESSLLWGVDLSALNLLAVEEEDQWSEDHVDVDAVIAQLVQCPPAQFDTAAIEQLLQQLSSPETPCYAIIGCNDWPQFAQVLPKWLGSNHQGIAAAAEQLLQQQLSPELLHCSPEPLAQLLAALLQQPQLQPHPGATLYCNTPTAAEPPPCHQHQHAAAAGASGSACAAELAASTADNGLASSVVAAAAAATAAGQCHISYSLVVLQFIISGLQKLGRQWHFLDTVLSDALCAAVVAMLLDALLPLEASSSSAPSAQDPELQSEGAAVSLLSAMNRNQTQQQQQQAQQQPSHSLLTRHQHQQQQQPHADRSQPELSSTVTHHGGSEALQLALQLLQQDPGAFSWWHRLNANAASSKPLKAAAQQQGLPRLLLQWAAGHGCHPPGRTSCPVTQRPSASCNCVAAEQQSQGHQQDGHIASACHSSSCAGIGGGGAAAAAAVPCSSRVADSRSSAVVRECLAVHCLAAMVGTQSGRQLLQASSAEDSQHAAAGLLPLMQQEPQQQQQPEHAQGRHGLLAGGRQLVLGAEQQHASPCSSDQPVTVALSCLQAWAKLQDTTQGNSGATAHPFAPWGPNMAAGTGGAPQAFSSLERNTVVDDTQPESLQAVAPAQGDTAARDEAAVSAEAAGLDEAAAVSADEGVVQAAVAAAVWALQAYEEQQPWFVTR